MAAAVVMAQAVKVFCCRQIFSFIITLSFILDAQLARQTKLHCSEVFSSSHTKEVCRRPEKLYAATYPIIPELVSSVCWASLQTQVEKLAGNVSLNPYALGKAPAPLMAGHPPPKLELAAQLQVPLVCTMGTDCCFVPQALALFFP